jgi:hypothetical protein
MAQYSKGLDFLGQAGGGACAGRRLQQLLHAQHLVPEVLCIAVTCSIHAVQMLHIMQVGRAAAHGLVLNTNFDENRFPGVPQTYPRIENSAEMRKNNTSHFLKMSVVNYVMLRSDDVTVPM